MAKFGPSFKFKKNLNFSVNFKGVDLTGINPSSIKFDYIAEDGTVQYAENDGVIVGISTGSIEVVNTKISHFSRYGFIK